jgi:hypothetical protein
MKFPLIFNRFPAPTAIFQPLLYKKQQCKNGEMKSGKKAM